MLCASYAWTRRQSRRQTLIVSVAPQCNELTSCFSVILEWQQSFGDDFISSVMNLFWTFLFCRIDTDRSGSISADELQQALSNGNQERQQEL